MWTGSGDATRSLFPDLATTPLVDWPNENMCSPGVRFAYGNFRYFTGGDLPGAADPGFPVWHSVESAITNVIGHVDVHVVNQHGSMGEESEPFLAALASKVLIIPSWAPSHPAPDVLKRIVNSRLVPTERLVLRTPKAYQNHASCISYGVASARSISAASCSVRGNSQPNQ